MICEITGLKASKVANNRIGVKVPGHPKANNSGYVPRARYIIEQYLGRYLTRNEVVHHKNRNKLDDRIENLELLDLGEHTKRHIIDGSTPVSNRSSAFYEQIKNLVRQGLGCRKIGEKIPLSQYNIKRHIRRAKKELYGDDTALD